LQNLCRGQVVACIDSDSSVGRWIIFYTIDICINQGSAKAKPVAVSACFAGHGLPRGPKVWHISPDGFRELRRSCLLSRQACARVLGCSPWTVRAWDRGQNRVPWVVVKLLRLLRLGELGALLPEWRGWAVSRDGLVSPEGYTYRLADLNWWGLTCREAEAWRQDRERRAAGRATGRSVTEPPSVSSRSAGPLASLAGLSPPASPDPADGFSSRSSVPRGSVKASKLQAPRARERQRAAPGAGLVSFQKQVERRGRKVRKNAAFTGGAR
jgi:hypothetical protein